MRTSHSWRSYLSTVITPRSPWARWSTPPRAGGRHGVCRITIPFVPSSQGQGKKVPNKSRGDLPAFSRSAVATDTAHCWLCRSVPAIAILQSASLPHRFLCCDASGNPIFSRVRVYALKSTDMYAGRDTTPRVVNVGRDPQTGLPADSLTPARAVGVSGMYFLSASNGASGGSPAKRATDDASIPAWAARSIHGDGLEALDSPISTHKTLGEYEAGIRGRVLLITASSRTRRAGRRTRCCTTSSSRWSRLGPAPSTASRQEPESLRP